MLLRLAGMCGANSLLLLISVRLSVCLYLVYMQCHATFGGRRFSGFGGSMLGHRRRRWPSIEQALNRRVGWCS